MICLYLQIQRPLCVSFSGTDSGLCIYYLAIWSNLNFGHYSKRIDFPTLSCQVLYSFCASLLLSLIMWFIVSSLLPHNLHYFRFNIVGSYGIFCVTIRKDSASLLKFHLPRSACERKQIRLHLCPREITSGRGRKWWSPFSTLTGHYS